VTNYGLSLAWGAHGLIEGDFYDPKPSEAGRTLGGASCSSLPQLAREERIQRMLAAALNRLRVEEEVVESSCGTSGPAKVTLPVGVPACV
jgi:hypothetical protein